MCIDETLRMFPPLLQWVHLNRSVMDLDIKHKAIIKTANTVAMQKHSWLSLARASVPYALVTRTSDLVMTTRKWGELACHYAVIARSLVGPCEVISKSADQFMKSSVVEFVFWISQKTSADTHGHYTVSAWSVCSLYSVIVIFSGICLMSYIHHCMVATRSLWPTR